MGWELLIRAGPLGGLAGGALALAVAALAAALAPSWVWLVAAFALLGAYLAADSAAFLTILPEFCSEEDRPTYIGLANTLLAPVTTLAPLAGGWLAALLGFTPMFAAAALVAALGAAMLGLWVREPRRVAAQQRGPAPSAQ
nr:MAG: hypothetical protein DIU80_19695 [Chloroflexota bacterium]